MYDTIIIIEFLIGKVMAFKDSHGPYMEEQQCIDRGKELAEAFIQAYPYIDTIKSITIDCAVLGQGA